MLNTTSLLKSSVKFDTESSKTNLPLVYFIERILKKSGFKTTIQKTEVNSIEKANLIATIGKGTGGLILSGHTDTVPAGSGWKTNPFKLTEKQGRIYGLGAVDMKGAIAAMLTAACRASKEAEKMRRPLFLAFTFDEERRFNGIKKLLGANLMPKTELAVVGEPTDQRPVTAHKGAVSLSVEIFGKEAHSSNPKQGVNAIETAGELILKIKQLALRIQQTKDLRFNPSYSTLNVGKIKGGSATNKVPAFCMIDLEYRPISKKASEDIFSNIKEIIPILTKTNKGVKIIIKKRFVCSPLSSSVKKDTISVIEKISGKKTAAVSYATEAPLYEEYGIPTVLLGPGSIRQAHQPNEFVKKSELQKAVKIYAQIIGKICF